MRRTSDSALYFGGVKQWKMRNRRSEHEDDTSSHSEQSHTSGWGKYHVERLYLWVPLT